MEITRANEDYLEAIMFNGTEAEGTRSIDVAKFLNVSKAAVSIAVEELIGKGLVRHEAYRNIFLTEEGRIIAQSIADKHNIIKQALLKIGVSENTAEKECCQIEHILGAETMQCLIKFIKGKK